MATSGSSGPSPEEPVTGREWHCQRCGYRFAWIVIQDRQELSVTLPPIWLLRLLGFAPPEPCTRCGAEVTIPLSTFEKIHEPLRKADAGLILSSFQSSVRALFHK
jgi:hypothetical protein